MNGIIVLDNIKDSGIYFSYFNFRRTYQINIPTDLKQTYNDILSNYEQLEYRLDFLINYEDVDKDFYAANFKGKSKELLNNVEYIEFDFSVKDVFNFVKENPVLKEKKIVFKVVDKLDKKIINDINNYFGNNTSNIYIDLKSNSEFVTYQQYLDTYEQIYSVVAEVKKLDLSPIEEIMYVYDKVRDKVYHDVDKDKCCSKSRDLTSSLLGDDIVCLGFTRIFNSILEELEFKTKEVIMYKNNLKEGHARSCVFVKDDKYDIKGVYYFDPTWDSRKDIDDKSYLSSYKYFAKTKSEMESLEKYRYVYKDTPCLFRDIFFDEMVDDELDVEDIPMKQVQSINSLAKFVYGSYLVTFFPFESESTYCKRLYDKDNFINKVECLIEYYFNDIPSETLMEILYSVRSKEFYIDPNKYPFSFEDLFNVAKKSEWNFDNEDIFMNIYGIKSVSEDKIDDSINEYCQETMYAERIGRVRVAHSIRNLCNYKRNKL